MNQLWCLVFEFLLNCNAVELLIKFFFLLIFNILNPALRRVSVLFDCNICCCNYVASVVEDHKRQ